jgi:hypothetical protein
MRISFFINVRNLSKKKNIKKKKKKTTKTDEESVTLRYEFIRKQNTHEKSVALIWIPLQIKHTNSILILPSSWQQQHKPRTEVVGQTTESATSDGIPKYTDSFDWT